MKNEQTVLRPRLLKDLLHQILLLHQLQMLGLHHYHHHHYQNYHRKRHYTFITEKKLKICLIRY